MAASGAMWTQHFVDMARGLIPYQKRLYKVTVQTGNGDVQMVTPTQAVVERAKMDMKRKLAEAATVQKPKRIRLSAQSGSGGRKRKSTKKKSSTKKSTKKVKTGKNKHQTKKKKKKPVQNKVKKVKSQIKKTGKKKNK